MLDACDRHGVLVMDELTDMWTESKSDFDAALDFPEWWERDVEAMVRKDRNHPSVVFYSIGNEIPEVAQPARRRLVAAAGREGPLARRHPVRHQRHQRACSPSSARRGSRGGSRPASTRCSPTWAPSWTSCRAPSWSRRRTAESYDVLDAAGMNYMDGPLRDRPGALPAPGDRRVRDLPEQDRPAVAARPGQPARDRRLHLDRLGLPRRGRRRPGHRSPTTRRRASSARPTRGCSRTSATSTSPATAARRRTTARSSSASAATRTSPSCGRSCTAGSSRPRRGRGATRSAAGAGPAPRASRSPSRSTATPTRSSCCWTAPRWASRRWGRRTASAPSSRSPTRRAS